ncbi:MAG: peptide chain release factor aRF-1 [Euryarchaeota archaeon]|nr:peptide chain release factor aRF-1 [Euryarchaeota archaeon]MBU4222768.1 peptide chain release factor aRF-1 [Euryarchaeota archaeon]MCG2737299.1 peptide chain release factor aRF-1 [Candidatus Methanoperedenaceae archaeon]
MAESEAHKKYEFKKTLEALRDKHGRGTELISLYIPHDKQVHEVSSQLREEFGQASNIKSRVTRQNVTGAIESLLSRLKLIPKAPLNGVVIFCGAVDIGANKTDMLTFIIEPPEPIVSYKYHCDSSFLLTPLEDMLHEKQTYGLIVLDRREATVGLLRGKHIEEMAHLTSLVPGKQRKGGQSAHRFQQLRLIAINDFYTKIADAASEVFVAIDPKEFMGVFIGGPSPTKEEFESGAFLHHEIQKKILGLFDVAYTDESGLYELFDKLGEALQDLDVVKEKKFMERFMKELVNDSGLASYGEEQVRKNLEMGSVDTLLLSDELRKVRLTMTCGNCGNEEKKTITKKAGEDYQPGNCVKCGSGVKTTESVDVVEELSAIADQMSTNTAFISNDFEEGNQLITAFGGIGAILRYKTGI